MKKFNKVIQIEVSVDEIAQKLLKEFSAESAHKEIITEAIIGNLLEKNRLGGLYSALNGYKVEVDFKIDQVVSCKETSNNYNKSQKESTWSPIGVCKIIGINEFADRPVKIEYQEINRENKVVIRIAESHVRDLEDTDLPYGNLQPHPEEKAV